MTGEYSVTEPDGTLRRVLYTADPENGFRASVRYVRPDESETAHDNDYNHGHDHDNHLHHQHRSPSPVSQNEFEYESNDPTYLTPPRPSSYFSDFDASQRYNDGVGDEYEDDGATPFKFPPSPRPLFKTADTGTINITVSKTRRKIPARRWLKKYFSVSPSMKRYFWIHYFGLYSFIIWL